MKVKNLLSMSALLLAAVMISCNGDDLVGEVISPDDANPKMMKFTATLAPKNESTRLLEDNETEITDTWEEGDLVAMIIEGKMYQGTVTSLDSDGSAYVTGEIPAEIESGTPITFRHPFAAVDENGEFLPNLLTMQDGTLNDIDVRTGLSEETGVLHVTDDHPDGGLTARLKERIVFENKVAICRFRFTDKDDSPIENIEGVNIFDDKGNRLYYVHLPHEDMDDRSTVYVAMEPIDPVQRLTFRVTTTEGDRICTGDINAKLLQGLYYKTTLSLKKQKDLTGVEITPDLEWAPENIGDGAGDYFAWAELTGHTRTSGWSFCGTNTPYYIVQTEQYTSFTYSKYDPDHKYDEPLELMDDAAHVNWGGDWRMPTHKEMLDLEGEADSKWLTADDEKNPFDVAGRMYSKKDDSNSYIVLPAAGYFSALEDEFDDYMTVGHYWTRSHRYSPCGNSGFSVVWGNDYCPSIEVRNSDLNPIKGWYWYRSAGMTIRPVRDKK